MPLGLLAGGLSGLLPLSFHRRRIAQAAEMLLSNIDLYANVKVITAGDRVILELRSPAAFAAEALEGMRMYLSRKLYVVLGLKLAPEQIYLVSLPPTDDPQRGVPTTRGLKRMVQALPRWSTAEARRGEASLPSRPSAFSELRNSILPAQDSAYVSTHSALTTSEGRSRL